MALKAKYERAKDGSTIYNGENDYSNIPDPKSSQLTNDEEDAQILHDLHKEIEASIESDNKNKETSNKNKNRLR